MTLTTLKARVDEAEEGSRSLDIEIARALLDAEKEKQYWFWQGSRPKGSPKREAQTYWDRLNAPNLTTSVDAALALVLSQFPYAAYRVEDRFGNSEGVPFPARAQLNEQYEGEFGWTFRRLADQTAATPALALISALLAALIAKERT